MWIMRVTPSSRPSASRTGDASYVWSPSRSKRLSTTTMPSSAAAVAKASVVGPGIGSAGGGAPVAARRWGQNGSNPSSAKHARRAPRAAAASSARNPRRTFSALSGRARCWIRATATIARGSAVDAGKRHVREPELLDRPDHGLEAVEVDRLHDVAVRVEVVALYDVAGGVRGSEDDDGDAAQPFVLLHLGQDAPAVLSGEVEIEEDEVGPRRLGVNPLPTEEPHCLHPVLGHVEAARHAGRSKRLFGQVHVGRIVFD